jgi:hypothetical protein
MTEAERKRRQRAGLANKRPGTFRDNGPVPKPPPADDSAREIAALKARIAELEAARGQGEYILEIERENSWLRGQLERERKPAKPKADKPPLPPDEIRDRQIKSLKTRVRNLQAELYASREWHTGKADGNMSFQTMSAISKVLHPDREPSETDRVEACKAFNSWKADRDASHRGSKRH